MVKVTRIQTDRASPIANGSADRLRVYAFNMTIMGKMLKNVHRTSERSRCIAAAK